LLADPPSNETIDVFCIKKLKVEPVQEKLRMLNCRPNARERLGRPLKGLLEEDVTGLLKPDR